MRAEDEYQEPGYLEEHLDRRRHAISDYVIGLALFAFSILAMAIGLDSAPAHTAPAANRPLLAFVIAMPATPASTTGCQQGGSSEAMRSRHVPDRNINTTLALRKGRRD